MGSVTDGYIYTRYILGTRFGVRFALFFTFFG